MIVLILLAFSAGPRTVSSVDAHGDPLLPGAMLRLGTIRWRAHRPQVAFAPDGRTLAVASQRGLSAWDSRTGRVLHEFSFTRHVFALAFSLNGKAVSALGLGERRANLARLGWGDWSRSDRDFEFDTFKTIQYGLAPDGRALVKWRSSGEAPITLLDAASGRELEKWKHAEPGIQTAILAPAGGWAAVINQAGGLLLYRRGKLIRRVERDHGKDAALSSVAFSPDGSSLIAVEGRYLSRYETATGKRTARREMWVDILAFRPDGKEIACATEGRTLLLDALTLKARKVVPMRGGPATSLAYSHDGRRLAIGRGRVVAIHDARTGQRQNPSPGHEGDLSALAFSPDGSRLASADDTGEVIVWNVFTGAALVRIEAKGAVRALAFSPDGRRLAAGDGDFQWGGAKPHSVRVWRTRDGKELLSFDAHLEWVRGIAFASDGRRLVTAGADGRVRWWDASTGKRIGQWQSSRTRQPRLLGVRGPRALIMDEEKAVSWVSPSGEARLVLPGTTPPPYADRLPVIFPAALLEDGRLALGQQEGVGYYNPADGKRSSFFAHPLTGLGPNARNAISPDGRLLVSPGLQLDLPNRRELAALAEGVAACRVALFSPDGSRLALASTDTTIAIYDIHEVRARSYLGGWLNDEKAQRWLVAGQRRGTQRLAARLNEAAAIEARARKLIPGLASDDFDVRERTSEKLLALGAPTSSVLEEAARASADLEIRLRCKRLLEKLSPEDRERWGRPEPVRDMMRFLLRERWAGAEVALRGLAKRHPTSMVGSEARAALGSK
jgi:WD40 repeat protein